MPSTGEARGQKDVPAKRGMLSEPPVVPNQQEPGEHKNKEAEGSETESNPKEPKSPDATRKEGLRFTDGPAARYVLEEVSVDSEGSASLNYGELPLPPTGEDLEERFTIPLDAKAQRRAEMELRQRSSVEAAEKHESVEESSVSLSSRSSLEVRSFASRSSAEVELQLASEQLVRLQEALGRLKRERDFHKMHHRRVVQEKERLITDLKRLRKHVADYEPTLAMLHDKYERAMKEKMLISLDRDRLRVHAEALEAHLRQRDTAAEATKTKQRKAAHELSQEEREEQQLRRLLRVDSNTRRLASSLPTEPVNSPAALRESSSWEGHSAAVAALSLHPTRPLLATAGDDRTWKLWSLPKAELVMSGEGHLDWIAATDFHPGGCLLATASGDRTAKVWDLTEARCVLSLEGHTGAVWSCAWHSDGQRLATASVDHTARVWDVAATRCMLTLRGHVDSVNAVAWQPANGVVRQCNLSHTDVLATASADKTVSLWDARAPSSGALRKCNPQSGMGGQCIATLYGHRNAVSHCSFAPSDGKILASCDADGVVKIWDVRLLGERAEALMSANYNVGANQVAFDRGGAFLAVACEDGAVRVFDVLNTTTMEITLPPLSSTAAAIAAARDALPVEVTKPQLVAELVAGHDEGTPAAVNALSWTTNNDAILTANGDQRFRLWCLPTAEPSFSAN